MTAAPSHLVASFLVLTIGGILNAGYLVYQHWRRKPLICPLDHDCSTVTENRWAAIFGVRNEVLGFLFYIANFAVILLSLVLPHLLSQLYFLLLVMNAGGLLFSLFLVWVQVFAIKDYCFYCLISALITLFLFFVSIGLYSYLPQ